MVTILVGLAVAMCVRAFWRLIVEATIIVVLAAVFVGVITLVEIGRNGLGG